MLSCGNRTAAFKTAKLVFGQRGGIRLSHDTVVELIQDRGGTVFVLPRDPTALLNKENAIVVEAPAKKFLVSVWRLSKSPEEYARTVEMLLASKVE